MLSTHLWSPAKKFTPYINYTQYITRCCNALNSIRVIKDALSVEYANYAQYVTKCEDEVRSHDTTNLPSRISQMFQPAKRNCTRTPHETAPKLNSISAITRLSNMLKYIHIVYMHLCAI